MKSKINPSRYRVNVFIAIKVYIKNPSKPLSISNPANVIFVLNFCLSFYTYFANNVNIERHVLVVTEVFV